MSALPTQLNNSRSVLDVSSRFKVELNTHALLLQLHTFMYMYMYMYMPNTAAYIICEK